MDSRQRAALSLILAIIVALTLLPSALGDGSGDDEVTVSEPAPEPADDDVPPSSSSTLAPNDPPTTTTTTTATTTTTTIPSDEDDDVSTTTTISTPVVGTPSSPAVSALSIDVQAIGSLIPGRRGVIGVSISNSAGSARTAVVAVEVTGATVVPGDYPGCAQSNLTVTCSVLLGPGESVVLPVTVAVEAGASAVGVTVTVSTSGPDPAPVSVTLPTAAGGLAASVAMSGAIDVSIGGNTLASCADGALAGAATCASVRDGTATTALTNDDWSMTAVIEDGRGVGSSSSAVIDVDPDSVVRALLIWAASTSSPTLPAAESIRFATPATTGGTVPDTNADYTDLIADRVTSTADAWQAVADVTDLVKTGGAGDYWVADIGSDLSGPDAWAGWMLVVVRSTDGPVRDVIILDGMELLSATATTMDLPMSTFSSVGADVTVLVWDGDRGVGGDEFALTDNAGAKNLVNSSNPVGDLANSTIFVGGSGVTSGAPGYLNTLGVDIDRFALGATTGPLTLSGRSSTDGVYLGGFVAVLTH